MISRHHHRRGQADPRYSRTFLYNGKYYVGWCACVRYECGRGDAGAPGKFARHKISFPAELRDERVSTSLRVDATDISGNGCYVETVMPPVRDPGVEMGIEFISLPKDMKKRFQDHLDKLDPGIPPAPKIPTNISCRVSPPGPSCKICNHCLFQPSNHRNRWRTSA